MIIGKSAAAAADEQSRKKRELQALIARDKELDTLFERMYEDNVSGKIDDARFMKMSKRYESEQQEIAEKVKTLRRDLKDVSTEQTDVQHFLDTIHRYLESISSKKEN